MKGMRLIDGQESLVLKLIERCDEVSIHHGVLQIHPASQKPVPSSWLKENHDQIIQEIADKCEFDLLKYVGYSAGNYSKKHHPGINLQFQWVVSGAISYVIFNANLTRKRASKSGVKGASLPKGHFRVGKRSKFYQFWMSTGLKVPQRLSSFHDYMGNLKKLVFIASALDGERLNKDSVAPLNLSTNQILSLFSSTTNNSQTYDQQAADNIHTIKPDNEFDKNRNMTALGRKSTAGAHNYGTRSTGNADTRNNVITFKEVNKDPSKQTNEEWLANYCKVDKT